MSGTLKWTIKRKSMPYIMTTEMERFWVEHYHREFLKRKAMLSRGKVSRSAACATYAALVEQFGEEIDGE